MFRTESKDNIGRFLSSAIGSKYESTRKFCIDYLKLRDDRMPDNVLIQNMANRVSQIVNGNKEIQIEDLPIFSELLGVSIEEILSAGNYSAPISERKTNYSFAYSNDPKEWEKYINRNDKLFLNPDEYNKTVIDYALEVGNYPLLKYLMDKKYIWFVSDNPQEYIFGFGAGTSIKRRTFYNHDLLDIRLKESTDLRYKMISLAIKNKDYNMLDTLHAREMFELYNITSVFSKPFKGKKLPLSNNVKSMIQSIVLSDSTKVIDYFFEEYKIKPCLGIETYSYVFPYADILLKELVNKSPKKARRFLEKAVGHNEKVNNMLQESIKKNIDSWINDYQNLRGINPIEIEDIKACYTTETWGDYYFYPENGFMSFFDKRPEKKSTKSFITNVIHVDAKSSDIETQELIDKLNTLYKKFEDYLKNKERKNEKRI